MTMLPATDVSTFGSYTREVNSSYGLVADEKMPLAIAALITICLTAMSVFVQEQALGLSYIEQTQLMRHDAVLQGSAPDPWAYRLFSEWVVAIVLHITETLQFARPTVVGYLTLRVLQNLAIFSLAISYYRRIGLTPQLQAIGVVLLAWSMSHALHNSDLSVNTYFDLIAYLIAALCAVTGRTWALIPVVGVAAFNRETAALIPMLAVAPLLAQLVHTPRHTIALLRHLEVRGPITVAIIGVALFGVVYLGIRKVIGPAPWPWGHTGDPLAMLRANLRDLNVFLYVPLTFSVLPILALWRWRHLSALLRGFLLLFGPLWVTTLFLLVYVAETRLLLVPIAVAFIPAALFAPWQALAVRASSDNEQRSAERQVHSTKQTLLKPRDSVERAIH